MSSFEFLSLHRLFRHKTPEEPLLLIYRDDPCVIVGRNQNPWKEVNFKALRDRPEIPFIRRRSGGGTVYHDLGNTNFSIHLPREKFDRHVTAQIVLRAVRSLGIDALVNDRNDICVGEEKMSSVIFSLYLRLFQNRYVSGSAYKIVNKRAYHHGTMLISTKLDTLGDLLRTNKVAKFLHHPERASNKAQDTMVTKGVASVRSPVCNLRQFSPDITHDSFTNAVVDEFRKEYNISTPVQIVNETDDLKRIDYIRKGMDELPSWDWAYGQTPEFTYTVQRAFEWGNITAEIRSKHGIINQCNFNVTELSLNEVDRQAVVDLGRLLEGQQYGYLEGLSDIQDGPGPQRDVLKWMDRIVYI
ncbi:hypothetical protein H0H87_011083 [Tephrocybe sp. NHM501043]|nr:hypothetical protein H0H87_011083 [Tephrocybe sp. NHM501043]